MSLATSLLKWNGADAVYRIDWEYVVLILENPIDKILKPDN